MNSCLKIICNTIHKIYNKINTQILLENMAGQKNELLYDFNDYLKFYKELTNKQKEIIKLCIDTCHLFASGYKLETAKDVDNLFKLIHKEVKISSLKVIHLNDSKYDSGSRLDRHASLTEGKINKVCLVRFIKLAQYYKIPMILETPSSNDTLESNYEQVNDINFIKNV